MWVHVCMGEGGWVWTFSICPHADCDSFCGNGFCTGPAPNHCCQGFNGDTGACVDECTTIDPNLGPNDDFVCGEWRYILLFLSTSHVHLFLGLTGLIQTTHTHTHTQTHTHAHMHQHIHTVCQISCDAGFAVNTTNCSCELTDGCEAAGQPCQNGGTCTSDRSAPPYYSCQCDAYYTGQNCSSKSPQKGSKFWIITRVKWFLSKNYVRRVAEEK